MRPLPRSWCHNSNIHCGALQHLPSTRKTRMTWCMWKGLYIICHICMHMYTHRYRRMYASVCINNYLHKQINTHICIYIYIYTHIFRHTHILIYIYMYIYFWMVLKKTVYWSIILLIFLKISLFYKVRKAGRKKKHRPAKISANCSEASGCTSPKPDFWRHT